MIPRLVVASHNRAKATEIGELLQAEGLAQEIISLADLPEISLPPETSATFAGNALLKATHVVRATGLPVVADDSGLEVEALGGEPGLHSARYAGPEANDEDRCRKVLSLLEGVPDEGRSARFRCAAVYATPDGKTVVAEGTIEGRIAYAPKGSGGFGYDPIFMPEGETRTMAELSAGEKHAISHRGRALRALVCTLRGD